MEPSQPTPFPVAYYPVENQPTELTADNQQLTIHMHSAQKEYEKVTVWEATLQAGTRDPFECVIKLFHENLDDTNELTAKSLAESQKLSNMVWNIWEQPGVRNDQEIQNALLHGQETMIVSLDGAELKLSGLVDHRHEGPHPWAGVKVYGVVMKRLGQPLSIEANKEAGRPTKTQDQLETEVFTNMKIMDKVLDVFAKAQPNALIHTDIKEQNLVYNPADLSKWVLIDYNDMRSQGDLYVPLSVWSLPSNLPADLAPLHYGDVRIQAVPAIDRIMLFYTAIRILFGTASTTSMGGAWKKYKSIKSQELKDLLVKPFKDAPVERSELDDDEDVFKKQMLWIYRNHGQPVVTNVDV